MNKVGVNMRCACVTIFLLLLLSMRMHTTYACWCSDGANWEKPDDAKLSLRKEFNTAKMVFSGEAVFIDRYKVKIKADKFWKGDFQKEVTLSTGAKKIIDPLSGESMISVSSCDYRFKPGERYLVFA